MGAYNTILWLIRKQQLGFDLHLQNVHRFGFPPKIFVFNNSSTNHAITPATTTNNEHFGEVCVRSGGLERVMCWTNVNIVCSEG